MLHTPRFSLQNAIYFIMLPFFGSCVIQILPTECARNLNVKLRCQKVNERAGSMCMKVQFVVITRVNKMLYVSEYIPEQLNQ
jgi:hypothetical protein